MTVELGVMVPHVGPLATAAFVPVFCRSAEEVGFHGRWVAEHLAIPRAMESAYTLTREPRVIESDGLRATMGLNLEMVTTLAVAAAVTQQIRLCTGVAVLPLRNPILNARQLASLDLYSGGRLVYGAGIGWLREEAEAMGMPWDHRGARADEHIAILREIWSAEGDDVAHEGEYYAFPAIDPEPQPGRTIPILIGGHSDIALERVARLGDGWISAGMSVDRLEAALESLQDASARHGRDFDALWLVANARLSVDDDGAVAGVLDQLGRYEQLGIDHVQVNVGGASNEETLDSLARWSEEVLPEVG
jgi:probable F420-dependent oxidoreductase